MLTLTFACFFFDVDLDGRPDIFAANGHVADDISAVQPKIRHAQPPHLFRNLGSKRFEAIGDKVGPAFQKPVVGRGAAYADFDGDGDLDLVLTDNNGPVRSCATTAATASAGCGSRSRAPSRTAAASAPG